MGGSRLESARRRDVTCSSSSNPGTRERHLESILQTTLQQLILVKNFPRCLVQVVLQMQTVPENSYTNTKLVQAGTVR